MHRILNYLAWPVVLGLLAATLTFNFFPEWLDSGFYAPQITLNEKKDEKVTKPFSYSLAVKKASILLNKENHFDSKKEVFLPYPLMNIINGGVHADNYLNIQEFMIRPDSAKNFMDYRGLLLVW